MTHPRVIRHKMSLVLRTMKAAALVACGLAGPATAAEPAGYLGHLQLDESTLVITEAVSGLHDVPWEITLAPDGALWFTQQSGTIHRLQPETSERQQLLQLDDIYAKKSYGLLGMALHPNFQKQSYVFLHYTYRKPSPQGQEIIASRLVRYRFANGSLQDRAVLLDDIPGAGYHNGSRILVTSDDRLFLTTGDAGEPADAQQLDSLKGKILRLTLDGFAPPDNPYFKRGAPASLIWSYGHRNPQGLALGPDGKLYATGHGANTDDEINLIRAGSNYGWPIVMGYCDQPAEEEVCKAQPITEPLIAWTPTIAPAGLAYYNHAAVPEWRNSLLAANLKGRALRVLQLNEPGTAVTGEHIYFQKRFGRIRDLAVASNGDIYLATSNGDWHPRYQPWMYDRLPEGGERILRLRPADDAMRNRLAALENPVEITEDTAPIALEAEDWSFQASEEKVALGEKLYMAHCASCHGPEGQGAGELIPPLADTDWVSGDRSRLIQTLLRGLSEPITVNGRTYDQEMPSFAHLSDQHIAAILTYIRGNFGNSANTILEGEVFEERKVVE